MHGASHLASPRSTTGSAGLGVSIVAGTTTGSVSGLQVDFSIFSFVYFSSFHGMVVKEGVVFVRGGKARKVFPTFLGLSIWD